MEIDITDAEFDELREMIHSLIGITLNDNKKMLVISRLAKRLKVLGLRCFKDYVTYLRNSADADDELVELINSITTNKTDFFREAHHFNYLASTWLPQCFKSGHRDMRIWSAGCSSGEEPYTIAMVADKSFRDAGRQPQAAQLKILATDVDTSVLARGQKGEYRLESLKDIPQEYRLSSLKTGASTFQMSRHLQDYITFGRFNLMHPFPFKYGFDIVFCRNVLIYFNNADRMSIIRKFHDVLREDGLLMLGHSESLLADQAGFINLGNTIYRKRGSRQQ